MRDFKKIEQLLEKKDELTALWLKSSERLVENHKKINQLIQNYRSVKKNACDEISQVIEAGTYHNKLLDPSAHEAYEACRQKLTGYIAHAQFLMQYAEQVTARNERLAAKAEISTAVVKANVLIRQVLQEEKSVLEDLKQDLDLFSEVGRALQD